MSGTSGKAKRLEAIQIRLGRNINGGVRYKTHVQTFGWQNWVSNGTTSGTSGLGKRLEAIQIELTGQAAQQYDIYYRVHVQSYGWLDWAKNGQMSGTSGLAKRLEESRLCSYRRELRHRERQREPASTGRIEGGLLYD